MQAQLAFTQSTVPLAVSGVRARGGGRKGGEREAEGRLIAQRDEFANMKVAHQSGVNPFQDAAEARLKRPSLGAADDENLTPLPRPMAMAPSPM